MSHQNDGLRQLVREVWRLSEVDDAGRVVRVEEEELRLRWIFRQEMRWLLELAGFEVEAEYSDFERSLPAYGREQVWLARPAGDVAGGAGGADGRDRGGRPG